MKETKNYNLKKPEPTDFYSCENSNENMDRIDEELYLLHSKASTTADGLQSAVDKKKLDGIEEKANAYDHPTSHSLSMITETTTEKKMTGTERTKLAGIEEKANNYSHPTSHSLSMITETTSEKKMTAAERTKLSGIATGANAYTHPTSGVSAGTKGTNNTTALTPAFGGTFSVPGFVVDANGHVTSANAHTVKIPSTVASTSANGLMALADKTKIDQLLVLYKEVAASVAGGSVTITLEEQTPYLIFARATNIPPVGEVYFGLSGIAYATSGKYSPIVTQGSYGFKITENTSGTCAITVSPGSSSDASMMWTKVRVYKLPYKLPV